MLELNYDNKYQSFCLPTGLMNQQFYIHIFYRNMDIEWVLEKFTIEEIDKISTLVLQATKHVSYNSISKNFICKNKWGWNKIERVLMNHYYLSEKDYLLPENLIITSLNNFAKDSDEWH